MCDNTSNNKRIAKNTLFLYLRMLLLMVISLYTSRVVLDKLGIVDFGVYNVVAGFAVMLGFFSSSLANVTQRFLNIELGRENFADAKKVFNQHLILYSGIIVIVLLIGETIGLYFVANKLVIPQERMMAAIWAYQFALFSLAFTLFGIVYNSAIVAHEEMKIYSYVGIVEGLAKLGVAYLISVVSSDRLIVYSFLLMVVSASSQLYFAIYCRQRYAECSLMWTWERNTIRQTVSFLGWNFLGTIIYMLKDQGINILMNIFYGPLVNAARAITFQISGAISSFNTNFFTSVRPQIIKSYAAGQMDYLKNLFFRSSKYSLLLMLFLCLPVMMKIDFILGLWLKEVPSYTAEFTLWVLIDSILATMTNAPWTVTMATGKLKTYVLYSNGILVMIFPLAYIAMKLGAAPVSAFMIIVVVRIFQIMANLAVVNGSIHYGYKQYVRNVVAPFLKVVVVSIPVACFLCRLFGDTLIMSLIAIAAVFLSIALFIWLFGTSRGERELFLNYCRTYFYK